MADGPIEELAPAVRSRILDIALNDRPLAVGRMDYEGEEAVVVVRQIDGSSGDRDLYLHGNELMAQVQVNSDGELIERDAGHGPTPYMRNPDSIIQRLKMVDWAEPEIAVQMLEHLDAIELKGIDSAARMYNGLQALAGELTPFSIEPADPGACQQLAAGNRVECSHNQEPIQNDELIMMIYRSQDSTKATLSFLPADEDLPYLEHSEIKLVLIEDNTGREISGVPDKILITFNDLNPDLGYTIRNPNG